MENFSNESIFNMFMLGNIYFLFYFYPILGKDMIAIPYLVSQIIWESEAKQLLKKKKKYIS